MKYLLGIRRVISAISIAAFVLFGILPNRSEAAAYTSQSSCAFVLQFHLGGLSGTDAETSLDVKVQSLVEQISKSFTESGKIRIAVCNFVDLDGKPSDFGIYLAEELITRLFQSGRFEVVERRLLDKVLDEQKLSTTGVLDMTSAQKLGSVLGVQAIVTGTLTDLQSTLKVNARIVSAQSGSVFAVASENINKTGDVLRLLPQTAPQTAETSSPHPTEPAQLSRVAAESAMPVPKTPSVVHAGPRFTKYDDGVIKDSKTGLEWYVGATKVNFDEATSWVAGLTTGGGGWRMPAIRELQGLYQKGLGKHSRDFAFEPCGAFIWSGEERAVPGGGGTIHAWGFGFSYGEEAWCGRNSRGGLTNNGVFAVRSSQR